MPQESPPDQLDAELPFPTDEELLAAGYVPINFSNMPNLAGLTTEAGHPFPHHHEIIRAGYVPVSRRERRILSRPRMAQMYWIDFPHDAYAPEFVGEHPGIVIRAANSLHDTCIILPVTSRKQKAGTHFHELSKNPNPKGQEESRIGYVVCDHLYTININRFRPLVHRGKAIYPKVEPHDMAAIFEVVRTVLGTAFGSAQPIVAAETLAPVAAPAKPLGPKTLTLNGRAGR